MTMDPSPSAARRKALREADGASNAFKVIETYPLNKYYSMADRLLVEFDRAMDERRLDEAYIYGIRFASFSVEALPKHKNYKHPQFQRLQLRNARQVDRVLKALESVKARMDAEELARKNREEEKRKAKEEKAVSLRRQKQQQFEREASCRKAIEESAFAKLKALQMESDRDAKAAQGQERRNQKGEEARREARAEEEIRLVQERKKIAKQAERLARLEKEKQARKRLQQQKEEEVARNNSSRLDTQSTNPPFPDEKTESKPHYLLSREFETIQLLEETIKKQEARLPVLEGEMTILLREAIGKRDAGDRKAAVYCMAKRKKLERNLEAVKGAIFTMETQILMMEAAASTRDVSEAMKAASLAMESLSADAGIAHEVGDVNQVMEDLTQGVPNDVMYDEDDLLSELEASIHAIDVGADEDILSLPSLPTVKVPEISVIEKLEKHKPTPQLAKLF